jgi:hypothetical protein
MHKLKIILIFTVAILIYQTAQSDGYKVPQYAYGLTVCDIDNDGDVDIIVGSDDQGNDSISILLNNGYGSFSISHIARSNHTRVFCGCMDSDELPDIASVNSFDSGWVYYPNFGIGSFGGSQIIYETENEMIYMFDLDADDSPDFVSKDLGTSGTLGVLYNNGSGEFSHYFIYTSSGPITDPDADDLDGDGLNDILTSDYNGGVFIFYNQGYADFYPQLVDANPVDFTYIFDIDNDGIKDLGLYEHQYFPGGICKLKIYEKHSNIFEAVDTILFPTGTLFKLFADFNNDGYFDIAYTRNIWKEPADSLYIVFNNQDMTFSAPDRYYVQNPAILRVVSADFDGNGYNDLAYTYFDWQDTLTVLFNDGEGKFLNNPLTSVENLSKQKMDISVFPNPFHSNTQIRFMAIDGNTTNLNLNITNLSGRIVRNISGKDLIIDGENSQYTWNGKDNHGNQCAPGVYLLKIINGKEVYLTKLVLID